MRIIAVFTLLTTTLFVSCRGDGPISDPATVEGRWELQRAMRNNLETEMLDGLYYEFGPSGEMNTNLMGNEAVGTYAREETTIITSGVVPPLTYEVLTLSDSALHLRTELQGFRFDFELARGE